MSFFIREGPSLPGFQPSTPLPGGGGSGGGGVCVKEAGNKRLGPSNFRAVSWML